MIARRFLLAGDCSNGLDLPALLRRHGSVVTVRDAFDAAAGEDDDEAAAWLLADAGPCECLLLAPVALGTGRSVEDVLTRNFALIKATLCAWAPDEAGRIVALLPGEAAMGDPAAPDAAAIAGGMLSLCRTVALELRKGGGTVNTILHGGAESGEGIALQILALADPASVSINGQEVYATGAADVGRLHP